MTQKKVIIVGGSSGIGKEMAKIYARQNYKVVVTGRQRALLEELKGLYPENIITACFDVKGLENIQQIEQSIAQLGGLDILIYNAGTGNPSADLDCETEMITTHTNVNGFVEIVCYAFNYFVKQGYGQIVATSSIAALRGNSWTPAYSASKAFMSNYAEGLAIKAQKLKKNIIITDVKPGFINTKMAKGNGRFWVSTPLKAAEQIVRAVENKKRVVYITKRWILIALALKIIPYSLYRHFL